MLKKLLIINTFFIVNACFSSEPAPKKAKTDIYESTNINWNAQLMVSCDEGDPDVARMAIEKGADCNFEITNGFCPFTMSLIKKHYNIASFLIDLPEFETNKRFKGNNTRLMLTIIEKNEDLSHQILAKSDINVHLINKQGMNALCIAIIKNVKTILPALIEKNINIHGSNNQVSALHLAATRDHVYCIEFLANLPQVDLNALWRNITPLMDACTMEKLPIVKFLLHRPQVDVNKINAVGKTALMCAALKNNLGIVHQLNLHGANPHLVNSENKKALDETTSPEVKKYLALAMLSDEELDNPDLFNQKIYKAIIKSDIIALRELLYINYENRTIKPLWEIMPQALNYALITKNLHVITFIVEAMKLNFAHKQGSLIYVLLQASTNENIDTPNALYLFSEFALTLNQLNQIG